MTRIKTGEYLDWVAQQRKESLRRQSKKQSMTPKGKEIQRESSKKYRENPENAIKIKARKTVYSNLRSGKLQKLPCKCGELKVQAHHRDYGKPLEIEWLCKKCHMDFHFGC